jgi:hypothetical protein
MDRARDIGGRDRGGQGCGQRGLKTQTSRDRDKDRQGDRQTERGAQRDRERDTDSQGERHRRKVRGVGTQTDREKGRATYGKGLRWIERWSEE